MQVSHTELDDLLVIEPNVFDDQRGYFYETYQNEKYDDIGINKTFVQDNMSFSKKGVLRGLHFQLEAPQGKLVFVVKGEVFDVAVDIRNESPTFGRWYGTILNDENHKQLYIPEGFAHGFYVLSEVAYFYYKCTSLYRPDDEYGIIWNDPDINIDWPNNTPILSDKDKRNQRLNDIFSA